ncbi:hypothetical protein [Noviherbaspirillum sp.]|uniref:hypothetical protein n=1 Tax=Noviherbaspirillum sp. TaxID=1926288 RepID=UPI002D3E8555|nr:hypothetical protein [Noviherbaspirillum sp.]HZW20184.1 hypothetical protein [Noviherbaspirillum sp.]
MQQLIPALFDHERLALREALRRDECRELKRAATDPEWADWHKQNARFSRRLLGLVESAGEPE